MAPPAASVGWALVGSLFRRSVALASGALSPSGVSRLGFFLWRWFGLGLVPTFFWGNSPSLALAGSHCLVVQAPCVSWTLCWGSFLSLPVFADSSGWLRMVIRPQWLGRGGCYPGFQSGTVGLPA